MALKGAGPRCFGTINAPGFWYLILERKLSSLLYSDFILCRKENQFSVVEILKSFGLSYSILFVSKCVSVIDGDLNVFFFIERNVILKNISRVRIQFH